MIGKTLSHFRVTEKLGEGGMGVVYRAEDVELQRPVALKVLKPEWVGNDRRRERFLREARAAAKVSHPNLAVIHEIGEAEGETFLAMEYVPGETLRSRLASGALPVDTALRIGLQVAEGLAAAHRSQVIHRDLKPENVMIDDEGRAKILDFGLAKLLETGVFGGSESSGSNDETISDDETISGIVTQEGRILGTVAYMSPEQARGQLVDARTDVFSFGITLYETLTGKGPFVGDTPTDTLVAILREDPPSIADVNPGVPADVIAFVERCLAKDPAERFADAGEVAVAIRRILQLSTGSDEIVVSHPSTASAVRAATGASRRAGGRRLSRSLVWGAPTVLVILGALFWPRLADIGAPPAPPRPPAGPIENSIAVMPFQNLKNPDDPERFGQILQELIITDLSELEDLKVFSSQRLFDLQKQMGSSERVFERETASRIAGAAGAHRLLEGSLSQLGDTWIVTAQLIDVEAGTVLRSRRIDGTDLYGMVDRLTEGLRGDLEIAMASEPEESVSVREKTTSSLEAYRLYLAGTDLLNAGMHQQAADTLGKAIELDPGFGQVYYERAMALWWASNADESMKDEAIAPLRTLLDRGLAASEEERLMAQGALLLMQGEWKESEGLYRRVLGKNPDEKEAWYGLGEAFFHGEAMAEDEAVAAFEKAIELDPSFTLAYRHVFDVYRRRGQFDLAIERIRRFIALDPRNPLGYRWWAATAIGQGADEEIEKALPRAREMHEGEDELQRLLVECGNAYRQRGDYPRALALLEEARGLGGAEFQPDLYWGYFEAMWSLRRYDELERFVDQAAETWPEHEDEVQRARWSIFMGRGQYDVAVVQADARRKRDLTSARAWRQLGSSLAAAGRWEELDRLAGDARAAELTARERAGFFRAVGEAVFEAGRFEQGLAWTDEAIRRWEGPPDPQLQLQRGLALARLERFDDARAVLAELEKRPTLEQHVLHIVIDMMQGRHEGAEQRAREILESGPRHAFAYSMLTGALLAQERYEEAVPFATVALEMTRAHTAHVDLAWAYVAGGLDVAEGVRLARLAQAIPLLPSERPWVLPQTPSAEHVLGLAQLKQGNYEAAIATLEGAARARPDRTSIARDIELAKSSL